MAIKPITRYGKFTPTGVDRSAETRMRALAGLGGQLQEMAIGTAKRVGEEKAVTEGTEAGRQAALEGKDVELKSTFKYGGANYNAALQKAYNLESYSVIDSHINEAATQHPDSAIEYQKVLDSKMKGMLEGAPEQFKGDLESYYRRSNRVQFGRVQGAEKKRIDSQLGASLSVGSDALEDQIGNLARAGDAVEASEIQLQHQMDLMNGVELGLIKPLDAETRIAKVKDEIAVQSKEGEVDRALLEADMEPRVKAENARELVETLRANPDPELSPAQNDVLLNRLDRKVAQLEKEVVAASKVNATELRKQQGIGNVQAKISGSDPITTDVLEQKDADNYYEVQQAQLSEDPVLRMNQQVELVDKVRFVPKGIKQEVTNMLRSGDEGQIAVGADTILRLGAISGMPETFTKDEMAFADAVNRQLEFYSPDEAVERAQNIVYPQGDQRRSMVEAREAELVDTKQKKKNTKAYVSDMEDMFNAKFFDGFVPNDIGKDALLEDYKTIAEDLYLSGFETMKAAREQAKKVIQSQWSTGEFGFMQHAPEKYYGLGDEQDASWIRDGLYEQLEGQFGGRTFEKENIFLVADTETARTAAQGKPTYTAMVRMDDGALESVYFVDDAGNVKSRINPALSIADARTKRQADIKAEAEAGMGKTYKGSFNAKEFIKGTTMAPEQQERMRDILSGSTNPFALLGKAVGNLDEVPPAMARYFGKSKSEIYYIPDTSGPIPLFENLREWNEGYLERLNAARGK